MVVIAPPPHYNRDISITQYRHAVKQARFECEVGPEGEKIWRCGYLPFNKSLTYRALNQGIVALSSVLTCFRNRNNQTFQPDLIIGTVPALPTAVAALVAGRVLGVPYVIDLRDAWPDLLDLSESWNEGLGKRSFRERVLRRGPLQLVSGLTRRALEYSYAHSSGMILTSDFLRKELGKRMATDSDSDTPPLFTIRNVFPPQAVSPRQGGSVRNNRRLHVLYAGTLGRAQQLSNAIEAVRLAKEYGCEVELRMVGAGATSATLREEAQKSGLPIRVYGRKAASDVAEHYQWADTALVHLADWAPLRAAVPSKTFELIQLGIHISGAVDGETANIIKRLRAGDVVPPNNPEALAKLWCELAVNPERLEIGSGPAEAVRIEALQRTPKTLTRMLQSVLEV